MSAENLSNAIVSTRFQCCCYSQTAAKLIVLPMTFCSCAISEAINVSQSVSQRDLPVDHGSSYNACFVFSGMLCVGMLCVKLKQFKTQLDEKFFGHISVIIN